MSKTTLKQIVESRYKLYKDYVRAYESVDKKSIVDKINPFLNASDSKDSGFRKIAMEIVKRDEEYRDIKEGEIIKGEIVSISRKEIIVDINYKDFLYIDNKLSDLKIIEN